MSPPDPSSCSLRAYYSDHFRIPLPPRHRFPIEKYRKVRELLVTSGVLRQSQLEEAPLVERDALELVHTREYLNGLFAGALSERELRRLGFPWSRELLVRSQASVGGTLAAAQWALEHGIGGNLAGGTHHAFADHGEGFCVFNDIAVAIRALQADIAFYQAGVDPLAEDSLGRLALSSEGLRARDRFVLQEAKRRDLPIVLTLGGGYANPIERSVEAHAGTYSVASEVFEPIALWELASP